MSEPVSESPDVQNPQDKRPMSEPTLHVPDVQDPQNKLPMSEPAPHTSAKRHWIGFSALASKKSVHIPIVLIYSVVSSR